MIKLFAPCKALTRYYHQESLYGINTSLAALCENRRQFIKLHAYSELYEAHINGLLRKRNPWADKIFDLAKINKIPVLPTSLEQLHNLSNRRSHQGIILACSPLQPFDTSHSMAFNHDADRHVSLYLDAIKDVMNLGSILRSAAFFGIKRVFISAGAFAPLSPLVSKLSAGAMESLDFYRVSDIRSFLDDLRDRGFTLVATCGTANIGDSQSISLSNIRQHLSPQNHVILALGSEDKGLNDQILQRSDILLRIPGFSDHNQCNQPSTHHITSLNVAVAAGVLFNAICS